MNTANLGEHIENLPSQSHAKLAIAFLNYPVEQKVNGKKTRKNITTRTINIKQIFRTITAWNQILKAPPPVSRQKKLTVKYKPIK